MHFQALLSGLQHACCLTKRAEHASVTPTSLLQEEQPVAALIALAQHLEGARFQAYWQAADACKDVVGSVPGYYEAVRAYILTAITSTCQKASKGMLAESLRMDSPQLDELVSCSSASN